jgi:hypothetical protein
VTRNFDSALPSLPRAVDNDGRGGECSKTTHGCYSAICLFAMVSHPVFWRAWNIGIQRAGWMSHSAAGERDTGTWAETAREASPPPDCFC